MIKAIIIEDEFNNRELLANMLTNYCTGIELLGKGEDVESGIELIKKTQPELVFLDIEMPDGNGFDILDACQDHSFKVVFVTGYDQYAIKAIKYAALDYLLKPFDFDELSRVIQRFNYNQIEHTEQLQILQENISNNVKQPDSIVLSYKNQQVVLLLDKIIYLQANDGYLTFFLEGKGTRMDAHTLSYYEELLPSTQFIRIHKSYIVNLSKVKSCDSGRVGNVYLLNGDVLPIAARRKAAFTKGFNTFRDKQDKQ